jgi:hypothetical protein
MSGPSLLDHRGRFFDIRAGIFRIFGFFPVLQGPAAGLSLKVRFADGRQAQSSAAPPGS